MQALAKRIRIINIMLIGMLDSSDPGVHLAMDFSKKIEAKSTRGKNQAAYGVATESNCELVIWSDQPDEDPPR